MTAPIVIVGAGQAGLQLAESLRQDQYEGELLLLGAETHAPYNRPPLSKKWLQEHADLVGLAIRGPAALERKRIELRTGVEVVGIDRTRRELRLRDGRIQPYSQLALATGARLRTLSLPGAHLPGVFGLRTIDDALGIRASLDDCARLGLPLVVIGGGFIGLEVAATARQRGVDVVVLESLERLMSRIVAPIVSEAAAAIHRDRGVDIRVCMRVTEIVSEDTNSLMVRTADGGEFRAGCVVFGVGVQPNEELAAAAGLECERGIVVDDCARTDDPNIVAAGDCTARRRADGSLVRLESVQNAVEQAKSAAAALLGIARPFTAAPWFWSDQYDVKLQMVGLSQGYDEVVTRGDAVSQRFSAYYLRGGTLIAVDSLNRIQDHVNARKLLDRHVTPTRAQIEDTQFDLNSLVPRTSS